MIVSVTGSRDGITAEQRREAVAFMAGPVVNGPTELHHGGCTGADTLIAGDARQRFGTRLRIVRHPGCFADGRPNEWEGAFEPGVDDEVLPPKTMFARNRDLVKACDVLIALPNYAPPMRTSGGTAYTVAEGYKWGRIVCTVWPDGTVVVDELTGKTPAAGR